MTQLPGGITEEEALEAIENAARVLKKRFKLPGWDQDDVAQFVRLTCWEMLQQGKFDPARGTLYALVFTHGRNRLSNAVRDQVKRYDSPCQRCLHGDYCQEDGPCKRHARWAKAQSEKAKAAQPSPLDRISDEDAEDSLRAPENASSEAEIADALRLLDENLDVDTRYWWLRLKAGVAIPGEKKDTPRSSP